MRGNPPAEVLLGYKKIGFGQGKFTGFGGKVEAGESILEAARREMEEETSVRVAIQDMQAVARLRFIFPHQPAWSQEVHVFLALSWSGEPVESDEMIPKWFSIGELPYARMWEDGAYWLPPLLAGRRIWAQFVFAEDNATVQDAQIGNYEEGE